jgi:hypothetical protein
MIGAGWYRQAVLAGQMGVPEALGLSWVKWVEKYMPKLKMAMRDQAAAVAELAQQEINGKRLTNTQIGAVLGLSEATVARDRGTRKGRRVASSDASSDQDPRGGVEPDGSEASSDAQPDSSARGERITRDNRAEQKRADRADQEAAVIDVPPPDLRVGTLSIALADVAGVDLVFTDPPYPKQYLPAWSELARWARHALKPGALLVAYSGQSHLPDVLRRLSEELTYQWLGWIHTAGPAVAVKSKPIQAGGKPLLIFSNGALAEPFASRPFSDTVSAEKRTRELHTWQQDEAPAAYYIEALTFRGELVVDPFLGSGTFAAVAHRLDRRVIGSDIDQTAVEATRARLTDA